MHNHFSSNVRAGQQINETFAIQLGERKGDSVTDVTVRTVGCDVTNVSI
jgi:hypothetical protein